MAAKKSRKCIGGEKLIEIETVKPKQFTVRWDQGLDPAACCERWSASGAMFQTDHALLTNHKGRWVIASTDRRVLSIIPVHVEGPAGDVRIPVELLIEARKTRFIEVEGDAVRAFRNNKTIAMRRGDAPFPSIVSVEDAHKAPKPLMHKKTKLCLDAVRLVKLQKAFGSEFVELRFAHDDAQPVLALPLNGFGPASDEGAIGYQMRVDSGDAG